MNKKVLFLLLIILIIFSSQVFAAEMPSFDETLQTIWNYLKDNIVGVVRIGIWLALFTIINAGLSRTKFLGTKHSGILSFVISLIAILGMPDEFIKMTVLLYGGLGMAIIFCSVMIIGTLIVYKIPIPGVAGFVLKAPIHILIIGGSYYIAFNFTEYIGIIQELLA